MAERRMFAKSTIDSDAFLDMPMSARLLYYDLGMRADDEGFVSSPKKISKMIGASDDDLRILVTKQFILPFESGVVVIKHWKVNNYIRSDRFTPTQFQEEKKFIAIAENGTYIKEEKVMDTIGIPNDNQVVDKMDTQVSIGKNSLVKFSIDKNSIKIDSILKESITRVEEYIFDLLHIVEAGRLWFSNYINQTFTNNSDIPVETLENLFMQINSDDVVTGDLVESYKNINNKINQLIKEFKGEK